MKKIRIDNYKPPTPTSIFKRDKMYWVSLGNNTRHSFTNRKEVEAFHVRVSKFLSQQTFELNQIYVDVFAEYRRIWFYFDRTSICSEQMDRELHFLNKAFDQAIVSNGENGNFNAFRNLFLIIEYLSGILEILIKIQREKNRYAELHAIEVHKRRLDAIRIEIEGFK